MAGSDNIEDVQEEFGISDEQVQALQQYQSQIWNAVEGYLTDWVSSLRTDVNATKGTSPQRGGFHTESEAQKLVEQITDQEGAFQDARQSLWNDYTLIILRYLEQRDTQAPDTEPVLDAVGEFFLNLHDPLRRETLLLAVKPEYRDDVRSLLTSIAEVTWGLCDMAEDVETDNLWAFLEWLSQANDMTLEELVRQTPNYNVADIPPEYRG